MGHAVASDDNCRWRWETGAVEAARVEPITSEGIGLTAAELFRRIERLSLWAPDLTPGKLAGWLLERGLASDAPGGRLQLTARGAEAAAGLETYLESAESLPAATNRLVATRCPPC
jgi:hypothetical protein